MSSYQTDGSDGTKQFAHGEPKELNEPKELPVHGHAVHQDSQRPWKRLALVLAWTPPWCRRDPDQEFGVDASLLLLCTFASAVTAANLMYIYPVLNKAADDFGVTYQTASLIPQLLQGGYGVGILFLCPLGDVFRLRPLLITLSAVTTATWLGLCFTQDFRVFTGLSFVTGFVNVSVQLLLPFIGAITPDHRKATVVSIVLAGQMMGFAVPRVVTGIVSEYTSWRNIYWAALALQCLLLAAMWLAFPDFPSLLHRNSASCPSPTTTATSGSSFCGSRRLRAYLSILRNIVHLIITKPILAHGCAVALLTNGVLASYWTVLTAHLAARPRGFGPLQIGLFSLAAVGTTLLIPLYGYLVVERFATWLAASAGLALSAAGIALDSYADLGAVGGPLAQAIGVDFGIQVPSVAYRAAVYKALPATETNRANVGFTACAFIGQLVGTSAGNAVYAGGGWTRVGTFHLAVVAGTLVVVFSRGPKEPGWVGWRGGFAGVRLERKDERKPQPEV
ncbi:hypothetical protein VTK26DRAFT_8760 [Humicola hyalothermophila]